MKQWREEKVNPWENVFVRNMYGNEMPLEDIAKFSGLTIKEVKRVIWNSVEIF